jgi:hypothetical protein
MYLEQKIKERLNEDAKHAMQLYRRCCSARESFGVNSPEVKSVAARYGAFINRSWRQWLIMFLTSEALDQAGTRYCATRERVRAWQLATFGRAIARGSLHEFAQDGPGARGADIDIPDALSALLADIYERNAARLADYCANVTGKTKA